MLGLTLAITCNGDLPESKIWVETVVEIGPDDGKTFQTTITAQPCSTDSASFVCEHPQAPFGTGEGFKIISEPRPNILQIQVLGQYSEIKIAILGSSWGGRWMLFSDWRWIQLCRSFSTRKKETSFRVEKVGDQYIIRGSCCLHYTISLDEAALKKCWTGRLLLAESDGGLMRLFNIRLRPLQLGKWTGKGSQSKIMVDPTKAWKAGKAGKALEQWKSNRSLSNLSLKRLGFMLLKSNL